MRLLNSPLLRRFAGPIRTSHPRVYAVLNRLRKQVIRGSSTLDAYQSLALDRLDAFAPLAGKHVLEVGSDRDLRVLQALRARGAARAIGINQADEFWIDNPAGRVAFDDDTVLMQGDVRELAFDDASFDMIFSVATFEHIENLNTALAEMHRVLRPGGTLYTNFGPIWSGGKGHHAYAQVGDLEARHFKPETNPFPDFAHLLMDRDELRHALSGRTHELLVEPLVRWTFDDPGINRLFHHEYLQHFAASPFRVTSIVPECDPLHPQLQRILEFRYPSETRFDVTNMEAVLTKISKAAA